MAAPIPSPAPVTTATRSCSRPMTLPPSAPTRSHGRRPRVVQALDGGSLGRPSRSRPARSKFPPVEPYGPDIYTEPEGDPNTLANLGPLAPMAGTWRGVRGADQHPVVEGTGRDTFVEVYDLQPIDRQTNGPQLFYGLRYHTHIVKPGESETFHDQVGYWLWEPVANAVTLTLGIPRGQVLLASGPAAPDATDFELRAEV